MGNLLYWFFWLSFKVVRSSFLSRTQSYYPTIHLSIKDVAVNNKSSTTMVHIMIKQSKTDPFIQGIYILYLGRTGRAICPVKAFYHTYSYSTLERWFWIPIFPPDLENAHLSNLYSNTLDGLLKELHFKKQNFSIHSYSFCSIATISAEAANIWYSCIICTNVRQIKAIMLLSFTFRLHHRK